MTELVAVPRHSLFLPIIMSRIVWWTCYSQLYESSEFLLLLNYTLEVTYNNNSYADEDSFVVEFTKRIWSA